MSVDSQDLDAAIDEGFASGVSTIPVAEFLATLRRKLRETAEADDSHLADDEHPN